MILELFGHVVNVTACRTAEGLQLVCDEPTLRMLVDAYDVLEPLKANGEVYWIAHTDFRDLESARISAERFVLTLTLESVTEDA